MPFWEVGVHSITFDYNSKLVQLVQLVKRVLVPPQQPRPEIRCKCCGGAMKIIRTRITTCINRLRTTVSERETVM